MKLTTSLPIIATGIISLTAVGQANAGARSCTDVSLHAEKLTIQAERYQKRAAQLKPGEHDKYIRALKRKANSMRAKAIDLKSSCVQHRHYRDHDDHHHHRSHRHSSHHSHFHY